jgi:hypothetical protein
LPDPVFLLKGACFADLFSCDGLSFNNGCISRLILNDRDVSRLFLFITLLFRLVKKNLALELVKLPVSNHFNAVFKLVEARVSFLNAQLKVNELLNDDLLDRLSQVFSN